MKILSIAAAPGWFAVYSDKDGTNRPLVCWAAVKDDVVVGMVVDPDTKKVDRADGPGNFFLRYVHESDQRMH